MSATVEKLGELHSKVADALAEIITEGVTVGLTEEGTPIKGTAGAAYFAVAVSMLKNNSITASADSTGLKNLRDKLEARRKVAKGGSTLNRQDMAAAIETMERDLGQPFDLLQ